MGRFYTSRGDDKYNISNSRATSISDSGGNNTITIDKSNDSHLSTTDGDDVFSVSNSTKAVIRMGDGINSITLVNSNLGKKVLDRSSISGGNDVDTIDVKNSHYSSVSAFGGNDKISVDTAYRSSTVGGRGNDDITINNAEESIVFGDGYSRRKTGEDNDIIKISNSKAVYAIGNDGDDKIEVTNSQNALIYGDSYEKLFYAQQQYYGVFQRPSFSGFSGNGNDEISVTKSKGSTIYGGGGNDKIYVDLISDMNKIDGGEGIDTLVIKQGAVDFTANSFALANKVINIETLDLTQNKGQITLNKEAVEKMTDAGKTLMIIGDANSNVVFKDKGWSIDDTREDYTYLSYGGTTVILDKDVMTNFDGLTLTTSLSERIDAATLKLNINAITTNLNIRFLIDTQNKATLNKGTEANGVYTLTAAELKELKLTFNNPSQTESFNLNIKAVLSGQTIVEKVYDVTAEILTQDNMIQEMEGDISSKTLHGFSGDDVMDIKGTTNNMMVGAKLYGESGDDKITVDNVLGVAVSGGDGKDVITVTNLNMSTIYGDANDDIIRVENSGQSDVYGDDGDDKIDVVKSDGRVFGGAGADTINVSDSNFAQVFGGDGNDTIAIKNSISSIYGDDGDDVVIVDGIEKILKIDGGTGVDTLVIKQDIVDFTSSDLASKISNIEVIDLTQNSGKIILNKEALEKMVETGQPLTIIGGTDDSVVFQDKGWTIGQTIGEYTSISNAGVEVLIHKEANISFGDISLTTLQSERVSKNILNLYIDATVNEQSNVQFVIDTQNKATLNHGTESNGVYTLSAAELQGLQLTFNDHAFAETFKLNIKAVENSVTVFEATHDATAEILDYNNIEKIGDDYVLDGLGGDDKIDVYGASRAIIRGGEGSDEIIVKESDYASIYGNEGNDIIKTSSPSNVYGGEGDDVIIADTAISSYNYVNVDGGTGFDTLVTSYDEKLDFTALKGKITNIEALDLGHGQHGDNIEITLDVKSILDITGKEDNAILKIFGDNLDSVATKAGSSDTWQDRGIVEGGFHRYEGHSADNKTVIVDIQDDIINKSGFGF